MRLSCFYTLLLCLIFNFAFSQKDTTQITNKYHSLNYSLYYFYFENFDISKIDTFNLINTSSPDNSIPFTNENKFTHRLYFNFYKEYRYFYLKKGMFLDYFSYEIYYKYYNEILYNTVNKVKLVNAAYKKINSGIQLYIGKTCKRMNIELGSDLVLTDVLTFSEFSYSDGKIDKDILPFILNIELYPQLSTHYLLINSKKIYINISIMYDKYFVNSFRYGIGLTKQF